AMEGAARIKMEPGKLGRYFVFGAYGSDSPDRAEITCMAMAKAARLHGRELTRDEVYVVGDTPRDIEAAHAAHATGVGVASGHYTVEELSAAQADHVLTALTEPFPQI
ncbi:HAD hydrolase-like protein, partial [Streptomyces sp. 2MCAF27]